MFLAPLWQLHPSGGVDSDAADARSAVCCYACIPATSQICNLRLGTEVYFPPRKNKFLAPGFLSDQKAIRSRSDVSPQ
jgi:hypothetical protein